MRLHEKAPQALSGGLRSRTAYLKSYEKVARSADPLRDKVLRTSPGRNYCAPRYYG